MKANDKHSNKSPSTPTAPLKASDYFPPGAGWNCDRPETAQPGLTEKQPEPRRH